MTSESLKGKYLIFYFGFTFCPDICPQELEKIAEVQGKLIDLGIRNLAVVFVTVDPNRDTCAQLDKYLRSFPGVSLALTSSPGSIKRMSRLFRVYYNESVSHGTKDYLIDHSIVHYLIDPSGQFVDFYGKNLNADEITKKVEASVRSLRYNE